MSWGLSKYKKASLASYTATSESAEIGLREETGSGEKNRQHHQSPFFKGKRLAF